MMEPQIAVVGGGLAGLAAAVTCSDGGAQVTLYERRPRLGGATWSIERHGLDVDNGQHVFMRCCTRYRAFLSRIGVESLVHLQERLSVPVLPPGGPIRYIRRARLPAPAHLAPSLLGFSSLRLSERLRVGRVARAFSAIDPDDPAVDEISLGDFLRDRGQADEAIVRFFDLLIRPTLNLPAEEASLALAAKVLRTGFLDRADGADVGWSEVPLDRLHAGPAAEALVKKGGMVELRARVDAVKPATGTLPSRIQIGGEWRGVDAVIVAAPPRDAARLLSGLGGVDEAQARALGRSPIVNLHLVYDRPVLDLPFLAALDSPVQWVFDRTRGAGLERGQYLTVTLSSAEAYEGRCVEDLRAEFEPALRALLPRARDARLERFFTTTEREATFRQGPGTRRFRPRPGRLAAGVHIAGAWTDTGWPATMESAVRSGEAAARSALRECGGRFAPSFAEPT